MLFPDEVLALTCVYVLVRPTFMNYLIREATKFLAGMEIRASLYVIEIPDRFLYARRSVKETCSCLHPRFSNAKQLEAEWSNFRMF